MTARRKGSDVGAFESMYLVPKDQYKKVQNVLTSDNASRLDTININQLNLNDAEKINVRHDIHAPKVSKTAPTTTTSSSTPSTTGAPSSPPPPAPSNLTQSSGHATQFLEGTVRPDLERSRRDLSQTLHTMAAKQRARASQSVNAAVNASYQRPPAQNSALRRNLAQAVKDSIASAVNQNLEAIRTRTEELDQSLTTAAHTFDVTAQIHAPPRVRIQSPPRSPDPFHDISVASQTQTQRPQPGPFDNISVASQSQVPAVSDNATYRSIRDSIFRPGANPMISSTPSARTGIQRPGILRAPSATPVSQRARALPGIGSPRRDVNFVADSTADSQRGTLLNLSTEESDPLANTPANESSFSFSTPRRSSPPRSVRRPPTKKGSSQLWRQRIQDLTNQRDAASSLRPPIGVSAGGRIRSSQMDQPSPTVTRARATEKKRAQAASRARAKKTREQQEKERREKARIRMARARARGRAQAVEVERPSTQDPQPARSTRQMITTGRVSPLRNQDFTTPDRFGRV